MSLVQAQSLLKELPNILGIEGDDELNSSPIVPSQSSGILLDGLYEMVAAKMAKRDAAEKLNDG